MIEDPVFIPLQGDAQLEVNGVTELRYGQHVHQAGGHIHLHRNQHLGASIYGEGRHFPGVETCQ